MDGENWFQTRRAFLGTALAVVVTPHAAFSQDSTMQIRCVFGEQSFTATLLDNPSARDFASMLPLDIQIEDYSTNEKIAYLPRKLSVEGSGPFADERTGDLCCYAPWGNLAFFHAGYRYSSGLIRLGRLDGGPSL